MDKIEKFLPRKSHISLIEPNQIQNLLSEGKSKRIMHLKNKISEYSNKKTSYEPAPHFTPKQAENDSLVNSDSFNFRILESSDNVAMKLKKNLPIEEYHDHLEIEKTPKLR